MTAFHYACKNDCTDTVEMILQKSAELNIDLNARDDKKCTGFHYACEEANLEIIEAMIKVHFDKCKSGAEFF